MQFIPAATVRESHTLDVPALFQELAAAWRGEDFGMAETTTLTQDPAIAYQLLDMLEIIGAIIMHIIAVNF